MKTITIKIDPDKANYLEKLNYELRFTKDIIQRLIEAHPTDPAIVTGPAFKEYQRQGAELEAEYNMAVGEIEKLYLPEILKGHQYSWLIPTNSDEMIITITCNCEIEGLDKYI